MAAEVQIIIEGKTLDLLKGEDERFYITKQLYDVRNLETRNAQFSRGIDFPLTPNNREIFGERVPDLARFDLLEHSPIPCQVLVKGIPAINDSFLIIGSQTATLLKTTVFGGTAKFFNSLKDKSIRELDFSGLNFDWTLAEWENHAVQYDPLLPDVVTAGGCSWYSNDSRRLYDATAGDDLETHLDRPELGESGFFLPIDLVIQKIFANIPDLTFVFNFDQTVYLDRYIAVNVPIIHESFGRVGGTYQEVQVADLALLDIADTWIKMDFPNLIDPPLANWNAGLNRFEFTANGFFIIGGNFDGTYRNNDGIAWEVHLNGFVLNQAIIGTSVPATIAGNIEPFTAGFESSINVENGDFIEIFYRTNFTGFAQQTLGRFIIQQQGAGRGLTVDVGSLIPDITQRDFVREVFKQFNMFFNELNDVVTLTLWRDMNIDDSIVLKLDESRAQSISATLATYAQDNIVKYADNDNVERLDADSVFEVNSQSLAKELIKIELLSSATDVSPVPHPQGGAMFTIPQYDLFWQFVDLNKIHIVGGTTNYNTNERTNITEGDFIEVDGEVRRVVAVNTDFAGLVNDNWALTKNDQSWNHWRYDTKGQLGIHWVGMRSSVTDTIIGDGGTYQTVASCPRINFETDQLWINKKRIYYKVIFDSVFKPFTLSAWAVIPVSTFVDINQFEPVYIEDYDAYFYLNKIEQWRANGLCRLELLELKI